MSPNSPQIAPLGRLVVEILAFDAVQLLDVAGPAQVFAAANEQLVRQGRPPTYEIRVVAPAGPVVATAGLVLTTTPLPEADAAVDTLVVAGGRGVLQAAEDRDVVAWIGRRSVEARRVASVCTGAFLLGAAGLLDGRRVATHWEHWRALARRFPAALVDPDPIFVRDEGIWTSAGVTAGIDLALALVEEDLGRTMALSVARHLVVFLKRPGGQAQFSAALSLQASDGSFGDLHAWIEDHLVGDLSLARLAAQAGMSKRTFSRRYREATGTTPVDSVERLRVEAARGLLLETTMPMKRIASRSGFGTEETMRRAFLRTQGCGPKEYRQRFG